MPLPFLQNPTSPPKFLMADDGEADYIIHCQKPKFLLRLHPDETKDGEDVTWWDPVPALDSEAIQLVADALTWGTAKINEECGDNAAN